MDADALYGLPLDRFVPERAALAKQLRSAGDREGATEVGALRKPSVAAWAVNQLVRTQPRATKELYAAGDALVSAQERLMAGEGDSRSLREANARERAAVDAMIVLARGLLSSEGDELSPSVLDRVSYTLNTAALDADARAAVRDGRLVRELQHAGLGAVGASVSAPATTRSARAPRSAPAPSRPAPAPSRPERGPDPREAERARVEARRAARVAEAEARRRAEVAERAVHAAKQRREVAAKALDEASEALARAKAEAEAADDAHARAKAELDGS
jgi:hypothetical protein